MRRDDGVKINGCGCGEGDALPLVLKTRCTGVEEGSSLFWVRNRGDMGAEVCLLLSG